MGLYLGGVNIASVAGTGGGGIPETAIFTQSGTWDVPQSVQDEIDSEGHAEVGLLMVGGGGANAAGEVVNELYQLTTADYNDSSSWADPDQPEISIVVGGSGADSGITDSMMVNLVTQTLPNINWASPSPTITFTLPNARVDAGGFPFISSVRFNTSPNIGSSNGVSNGAFGGTTAPTFAAFGNGGTWSYTNTTAWDGTQSFSISGSHVHTNGAASIRGNANGTLSIFDNNSSIAGGTITISSLQVIYESANPLPVKVARSGNSTEIGEFLNNPLSTEGHFGGFGRYSTIATGTAGAAERPNSGAGGANAQGGYVQIFFT